MFESVKEFLYVAPGDSIRNESINRQYRLSQWNSESTNVSSASQAIMADIRQTMANTHEELECE